MAWIIKDESGSLKYEKKTANAGGLLTIGCWALN
jgi:hypothetical protein